MRFIYLVLLLVFVTAVGLFAYQNNNSITLKYLDREAEFSLPAVIGAVYVLGMLTGWTVVGILKRTFQRATERRHQI